MRLAQTSRPHRFGIEEKYRSFRVCLRGHRFHRGTSRAFAARRRGHSNSDNFSRLAIARDAVINRRFTDFDRLGTAAGRPIDWCYTTLEQLALILAFAKQAAFLKLHIPAAQRGLRRRFHAFLVAQGLDAGNKGLLRAFWALVE